MPVPKKQKQEQPLLAAPDSQQLSQSQSPPNLPPSPETLHSPNINPLDRTGQPADSVAMATGAVPVYQPSPSRSPQIPASVTSPSNLPGSDAASQDTPNLKAALSPVHDNGFDMSTLSKVCLSSPQQRRSLITRVFAGCLGSLLLTGTPCFFAGERMPLLETSRDIACCVLSPPVGRFFIFTCETAEYWLIARAFCCPRSWTR